MKTINDYGLESRFENEATLYPTLEIARIIGQYKGMYKIITKEKELLAKISGKFRYEANSFSNLPVIGDFVMISYNENDEVAMIHNILTRKSSFERKLVGKEKDVQVVASNIDIIFICMSLNNNFNLNRLERYLSISYNSGAIPVILLTKKDLCENLGEKLREVENVANFTDIITTSSFEDESVHKILRFVAKGKTASFIGSSGVGKSTLINKLMGADSLATFEVGKEDKGRHTTTNKEMMILPNGGIVIDTPGMREVGVEGADLFMAFNDIDALAKNCKFGDCTHTNEPNCAVLKAVKEGSLDKRRLENYFKIKMEMAYEGLSSREIENAKFERMFKEVGGMKNARKVAKRKNKGKF